MWKGIIKFASKVWRFICGVVQGSWKLFKKELKQKHANINKMNPLLAGRIIQEEGLCFFLSASKNCAASILKSTGAHRIAALTKVFSMPYDDCFGNEGISLWNLSSEVISQISFMALNGYRPSFTDRSALNFNINQLASIIA